MKRKFQPAALILFAHFAAAANKLADLRQQRASKVEAQGKIIEERSESEDQQFTEEQSKKFNDLEKDIKDLDEKIVEEERIVEAEKRAAALKGESKPPKTKAKRTGGEKREKAEIIARANVLRGVRAISAGKTLEGAEKEMNEIAIEEARVAGVEIPNNARFSIPMSALRADAQTVTKDDGEYGGELVKDDAPRLQMPFVGKTFLEKLGVTFMRGLVGNVPLPVAGAYELDWLEEMEDIEEQKTKIKGPKLTPKRIGGGVPISNQLIRQTNGSVDRLVRQMLFNAYDRGLNKAAINGSGGKAPTGILNNPDVLQSKAYTAGAKPERGMITELPGLIAMENATENALAFLMNPELRGLLQDTKVDEGSGLFVMNRRDELNGYQAEVSSLVPNLSDNRVLLFGDWSKLFVGEWGPLSLTPEVSGKSDSVTIYVNGYADVEIAQPDAFAYNKYIDEDAE